MDLKLRGKRALITGSNIGIGEGIAKALTKEGVTVVVHGRNEEQANRVAQEISNSGGKAIVAIGDLSNEEATNQVVNQVLSSIGGVDILINNAGQYENGGWQNTSPDKWAEMYNANVISAVRMIQLLIPQMRQLGWGRIIQIASITATQPFPLVPQYSATKAALVNLTVSLAKELAQTGITVNTVSPGIILSPRVEQEFRWMAANFGWGNNWEEIEKQIVQKILYNPTGRLGHVEDVVNLVCFLSSPLADYINSANIRVDGGSTATIN